MEARCRVEEGLLLADHVHLPAIMSARWCAAARHDRVPFLNCRRWDPSEQVKEAGAEAIGTWPERGSSEPRASSRVGRVGKG